MEFTIKTIPSENEHKPNVITTHISGEILHWDYAIFKEMMDKIIAKNFDKYVIDLSNCKFIDSAGFGMFVIFHDEIKTLNKDAEICLINLQKRVRDNLYAYRFDTLFNVE